MGWSKIGTLAAVVLAVAGVVSGFAEPVTPEQAIAAANVWSAQNSHLAENAGIAQNAFPEKDQDGTLLWYAVPMSGGKCVITAPDTEIEPIIAVVDKWEGEMSAEHPLRILLTVDMRKRLGVLGARAKSQSSGGRRLLMATVNSAESEVDASARKSTAKWAKLAPKPGTRKLLAASTSSNGTECPQHVVKHLLPFAKDYLSFWDQFEEYTPNHYPAGCVATVGAILLHYFKVEKAPHRTKICTVDGVATNLTTKGIDYDWTIIPEKNLAGIPYSSIKKYFNDEQYGLICRVLYDMGVCVGMSYTRSHSSAFMRSLAEALRDDYGFSDARRVVSAVPSQYDKLIYSQIYIGMPVALSISYKDAGETLHAHAVVAVGYGYDTGDAVYTRIDLGWTGGAGLWYQLPDIGSYDTVDEIVTMIGVDSSTVPLCGRVMTESGIPVAYEQVLVNGVSFLTDENGYWGARVPPVASQYMCVCRGETNIVAAGSAIVKTKSVSIAASDLVAAIPDPVNFIVPSENAFTLYDSPYEAQRAALRDGKMLLAIVGSECESCNQLKAYLKSLGTAFTDKFVVFYANTLVNAYGMDDAKHTGSVSPYWGIFDPRVFKLDYRWMSGNGQIAEVRGWPGETDTLATLNNAKAKWKGVPAPISVESTLPDAIAMPTALEANLTFSDGIERKVADDLNWSLVFGAAATISSDGVLSPRAGASGDVTVEGSGCFWGRKYVFRKTVHVVGAALTGLTLTGPRVIDLYDMADAQFTAMGTFADGSRAAVPATYMVEETVISNAEISASGKVTFSAPRKYQKASRLTVRASYGGHTASASADVWGWNVKLVSWSSPQRVLWPGQTGQIVPEAVQWWRHGVTEEVSTDMDGLTYSVDYGYVNSKTRFSGGNRTMDPHNVTFVLPADLNEADGYLYAVVYLDATRFGKSNDSNLYCCFKYLSAVPLKQIEVTFASDGGFPDAQTVKYADGKPYGYLPEPYRKGHVATWYTALEGGGCINASSNCQSDVTKLYAHWTPCSYSVYFDENGGSGRYMSYRSFYYNQPQCLPKCTFTRDGHMFIGWATSSNGNVVYRDEEELLLLFDESNVHIWLYAVWLKNGYCISFDSNGGEGVMARQFCQLGTESRLPVPTISRKGCKFLGWSRTPDGEVEYVSGAEVRDLAREVGETVALYAVWEEPAVATIAISGPSIIDLYDVDGAQFTATCKLANGQVVQVQPKWTIEETAVVNAAISASGYVKFQNPLLYTKPSRLKVTASCGGATASVWADVWGWSAKVTAWTSSQHVFWPGQTGVLKPAAVQWWRHGVLEPPGTDFSGIVVSSVDGEINGRSCMTVVCPENVKNGITFTVPANCTESAGNMSISFDVKAKVHGHEASEHCCYECQYFSTRPASTVGVTFYADGGSPSVQTSTYAVGAKYQDLPTVYRRGYSYWWYTATEGGTEVTWSSICSASVTKLYARWVPESYLVEYDANGGSGGMSLEWHCYDEPQQLAKNAFARDGFTFVGWSSRKDGLVEYTDQQSVLNLSSTWGVVTLYAVWKADSYKIRFFCKDGTGTMDSLVCVSGTVYNLANCAFTPPAGKRFAGWACSNGRRYDDGMLVFDLAKPGETVTMTAIWE